MIQQINLLNDFANNNGTNGIDRSLYSIPMFCLLLALYSLYLWSTNSASEDQLTQLQQTALKTEAKVKLLQQQLPSHQVDKVLEQKLLRAQNAQHVLQGLLQNLTQPGSDQTGGFAHYFSALARQVSDDTWLTRIYINADNSTLLMQGSSFGGDKVAGFLQALQRERSFKGHNFARMQLQRSDLDEQSINFSVTSDLDINDAK